MRTCRKCHTEKPLDAFVAAKVCTGGRAWTCRECKCATRRVLLAGAKSTRDRVALHVCRNCDATKPASSFNAYQGGTMDKVCRGCRKADKRRREGDPTRAQYFAQRRARKLVRLASKPPRARGVVRLRRELRTLLGKLLAARCAEQGENGEALRYRARYRTNAAFREKEIARRWAQKQRQRYLHNDGTLTSAVLCSLFAAATHCTYCHEHMRSQDKTLDHVIPLSRGGLHGVSNVVVCCRSCNCSKHASTPAEWSARMHGDRRTTRVIAA